MTNIQSKLDNIISELNFIKNNLEKEQSMEDFCAAFKLALISKLEQAGAIYDPTLEHIWCHAGSNTTENKKFFAFKKSPEPEENEILSNLKNISSVLTEYRAEFGSLAN